MLLFCCSDIQLHNKGSKSNTYHKNDTNNVKCQCQVLAFALKYLKNARAFSVALDTVGICVLRDNIAMKTSKKASWEKHMVLGLDKNYKMWWS